jgi:hypothetical protein
MMPPSCSIQKITTYARPGNGIQQDPTITKMHGRHTNKQTPKCSPTKITKYSGAAGVFQFWPKNWKIQPPAAFRKKAVSIKKSQPSQKIQPKSVQQRFGTKSLLLH